MLKKITFKDVGCSRAFDLAFDYIAIVEKIQTWNISNDLNDIDNTAREVGMTEEQRKKATFSDYIDKDQQVLQSDGTVKIGSKRRALVGNKSYNNGIVHEGWRTWKIQALNRDKEWYTSDNIIIHSMIHSEQQSCYNVTIQSNSRDLVPQLAKQKFPKEFSAPALFKHGKEQGEELDVDMLAVNQHKWQLQNELIELGATFDGSGKIYITLPKGKDDDRIKQIMGMMRKMYGFDSKASQDDSSFYIETSEYIFNQIGLTRFLDECKNG